ncbi:MAG: lipoyl(octanoyl) transferase LipB [Ardenticatenaceae bacterium]|nr:lipoyl(octanoyl) transferase LipB [Ardenticatenaceae bacterium]
MGWRKRSEIRRKYNQCDRNVEELRDEFLESDGRLRLTFGSQEDSLRPIEDTTKMITASWLGQIEYDTAWDQQKAMVAARIETPDLPDEILLLEHPPTYTLGRSGTLDHLLLDETALEAQGFTVRWVDRGGDITYHGPGQLVGYPILNLKRMFRLQGFDKPDFHRYLRNLEEVIIVALAEFGIAGWRYDGYTGVWVDWPDGPRKIAAIGVRVNVKGISSHGFALNVNPDMSHFGHIIPCGISEHGVVCMAEMVKRPLTPTDLLPPITRAFTQVFETEVTLNEQQITVNE